MVGHLPIPAIILSFLAFLLALSVHEAAHAWVAWKRGDETARKAGRITLNPLHHIELFGSVILPLVSLVSGGWMIGWAKPTPVDPARLKRPRWDDLLVSGAGPVSNLLLALAAAGALHLLDRLAPGALSRSLASPGQPRSGDSIGVPLANFLEVSVGLNVLLAVFNLIPIPPLDGSRILRQILPRPLAFQYEKLYRSSLVSLLLLVGIVSWGVPEWLLHPVMHLFGELLPRPPL